MFRLLPPGIWYAVLWVILTSVSVAIRPLIPVDETRYAAVAWEMWLRGDFLVPHLNGETYSHKPPLLFWLMQFSWWLFGVNDWSLRFISPLFALGSLFLTREIARQLWPESRRVADSAPFILISFFIWIFFSTLTMFDIMLTFFVLAGMVSLLKIIRGGFSCKGWVLVGAAIGGGILSKGPVILLHMLPVAVLAPWWLRYETRVFRWSQWYGGILLAIVIGAAIALCWAIPASLAGGEAYRRAIFLGQTSGRLVDSFAHRLPWWWYFQLLPVISLPWLFMKPVWSGFRLLSVKDFGIRFCLAWAVPVFLAFSMISGKRIHYLLPLIPVMALLLACAVEHTATYYWNKVCRVFAGVAATIGLAAMLMPWLNNQFHWLEALPAVSPLWGAGLVTATLCILFLKAANTAEAVAYIAITSLILSMIAAGGYFSSQGYRYDITPPANKIAGLFSQNNQVAVYTGKYHGQFNFTGRLRQPLTIITEKAELAAFLGQNPDAYVVVTYKDLKGIPETLITYSYPFKNQKIGILPGKILLDYPDLKFY
jgi:4-amino-4-deoxy-L-arabinose transferase-like glycosyltransferase